MRATVVVSGGTGGLGVAVTHRLLEDGFRVVVPWYDRSELDRLDTRADLELVEADLMTTQGVAAVLGRASSESDLPLHGVVNLVGGFASGTSVADTPVEEFERLLRLNLRATYLLTQGALPEMASNGGGSVVAISARAASSPFAGAAGYITAKAAVWALIESIAVEYSAVGIRANALAPSVIDTPGNRESQPDAKRAGWVSPAAIADVVSFLMSDDSRAVTGARIPVPGVTTTT